MTPDSVRILFITKEVPYPPIGGPALRTWQNINIMMKFGSVAVFSASTWNPKQTSLPGVALWNHYNLASARRSLWEELERRAWWLRPRGNSDVDWTYSNSAGWELEEVLAKFQPDLVIFEELWLYRYLPLVMRHKCRIIFDDHNIEACLFQEKYALLQTVKLKLKAKIQLPKLKSIERDFIRQAAQVWVCSDNDVSLLQQLYGQASHTHVVPNGLNVAHYDCVRSGQCSPPSRLEEARRTILFMGQLSFSANTLAAELLINEIYPRLRKIYPDCRLLIVGRTPTQVMQEAAKRDPEIIVTGWVADIRPYLAAASVLVVPLMQGGGTRLKLLEAFAAGCPVVSTAKGAEGLMVRDGEHLLIRNSIEELVAGVCQLLSEPSLGEKLARSAYELVQAEYSWEAVGRRVEQAVQELF